MTLGDILAITTLSSRTHRGASRNLGWDGMGWDGMGWDGGIEHLMVLIKLAKLRKC